MALPTITNSYGQSKWGTTTTRLNAELLNTGSTLTQYFTAGAIGLSDTGSWSRTGECYVAYDYLGFWDSSEDFTSPRDAGTGTPTEWSTALVIGNSYTISFTLDNTASSKDFTVTVGGNTFTYESGDSGFKSESFTASSTAKPVFSSPADADGLNGGNYCGITAPLSLVNAGEVDADITIYWGDNDGGTTAGSWDNAVDMGTKNIAERGTVFYGKVYTDLTGLTAGATYYYRAFATNANGDAWASSTRTFYTLNTSTEVIRLWDIYNIQAVRDDGTKNYRVMCDIDASPTTTMNPIYTGASPTYWGFYPISYRNDNNEQDDAFSGVFDGGGYKITGLWAQDLNDNGGWGGLFGRANGRVQQVILVNPTLASSGAGNAGCIVGFGGGTIQCCGVINPTGSFSGIWSGGIAGQASTVRDCYSKGGKLTSTSVYAGGIAGQINGSVTRCWSSTEFSVLASSGGICGQDYTAPLTYCFATGKSTGSQSGCLTGYMYTSETGNYWYNNASFSPYAFGNYNNTGGNNLTATAFTDTADFKGNKTHTVFATWDFDKVWRVVDGDYPQLACEVERWREITVQMGGDSSSYGEEVTDTPNDAGVPV